MTRKPYEILDLAEEDKLYAAVGSKDLYKGIFDASRIVEPDNGYDQREPLKTYPMEEIRETWEAFKAIDPVNNAEDCQRRMEFVTDDCIMQNPVMYAKGRDEVYEFMLADLYWTPPVFYWECFGQDRVAFKWSQFPRRNQKPNPKVLFAISEWTYAGNGKFSHYYARWCRFDGYMALADAGIQMPLEALFSAPQG